MTTTAPAIVEVGPDGGLPDSPATARRMISACEAAGVLLLEAYMSPFHPGWDGAMPAAVSAWSRTGGDGVDATTSAWLAFADGRTAHLWVSLEGPDQQRLALTGTAGSIEVDVPPRHPGPS